MYYHLRIEKTIQFNKSQHVGINKKKEKIYRMGKFYISRDADKHGGGEYKIAKFKMENTYSKNTRLGTYILRGNHFIRNRN